VDLSQQVRRASPGCLQQRFPNLIPGDKASVEIRKVIQRRIRQRREGVDIAGDLHAVIAANLGPSDSPRSHAAGQEATKGNAKEERDAATGGQQRADA
jgi:hypothetical protein